MFSCEVNTAQTKDPIALNLAVADFNKALSGKINDAQIVDVRTPGEFNGGHINNAQNIDFNDRKFEEEIKELDKNKATFIYCLSGGRSAGAMAKMQALGFTELYNLQGGIMSWRQANLPLSTDANASIKTDGEALDMNAFNQLINDKDKMVIVDFNATWCGPCKVLKPIMHELEAEQGDKIKVVYIDVDKHKAIADQLKINEIPLLHYYRNGKLVMQTIGLMSKSDILKIVKKY